MCNINIDGVTITLTKEQLKQIEAQKQRKIRVEDINSIEDAENILKDTTFHTKYKENQFIRKKDWTMYQIETIAKACNFIDNGFKEWLITQGECQYYPYFQHKPSVGWVYYHCDNYVVNGFGVVAYFKNSKTAKLIASKFIHLYKEILPKFD